MNRLVVTVPAKLNLHLQVLGKRADEYHDVWTLFQSIDLADGLHVEDSPDGQVTLTVEPTATVPVDEDNLVLQAVDALRRHTGLDRGAVLRLCKRIPVGAGLGGGSADAAGALFALDRLWGLHLPLPVLSDVASDVGSDVAFFLHGGLALGHGRGDQILPLPDMRARGVVVAAPPLQISTTEAFAELDRRLTSRGPDATVEAFVVDHREDGEGEPPWRSLLNDFERVVTQRWPEVGRVARAIRDTKPLHAGLTGSGAAVFGIFADLPAAHRAAREIGHECLVHVGSTLGRRQVRQLNEGCEQGEEDRSWK